MERDGRSFDHKTLGSICLMAVERVREGERASSVIASYGFNRTTIYKWLAVASRVDFQPSGVRCCWQQQRPDGGRDKLLQSYLDRSYRPWQPYLQVEL
jgi:hypothetical protein